MPRTVCTKCNLDYQVPVVPRLPVCAFCSTHRAIQKDRFKVCPNCKHDFYVYSVDGKDREILCCSDKCRQEYTESGKRRIECNFCGKRVQRCPSQRGSFCSWECMCISGIVDRVKCCPTCTTFFLVDIQNLYKQYCSKACEKRYSSGLEVQCIDLLRKHNLLFTYTGKGSFNIKGFKPDFICVGKKVVLEVNGCYWHSCMICSFVPDQRTKVVVEKDIRKNSTYKQEGWTSIVAWEHEFSNPTQLATKIKYQLDQVVSAY